MSKVKYIPVIDISMVRKIVGFDVLFACEELGKDWKGFEEKNVPRKISWRASIDGEVYGSFMIWEEAPKNMDRGFNVKLLEQVNLLAIQAEETLKRIWTKKYLTDFDVEDLMRRRVEDVVNGDLSEIQKKIYKECVKDFIRL